MPTKAEQSTPPPLEDTRAPHAISLRVKFILTLGGLSLLPFFFIVLHLMTGYGTIIQAAVAAIPDTVTQSELAAKTAAVKTDAELLGIVFLILIALGTFVSENFFTGEVRTLLRWLRGARANNFREFTDSPVASDDELGQLGREMRGAITYFQTVEAREKQVLQQKAEFISIAAHQMRTPLTGLRWGIESVLALDASPEERKKTGVGIYATVERMINLVDDLLDAAKMEEGKFGYNFQKVDIVPIIKKLLDHFELIARARTIALTFDAPALPEVYIDPERIATVVSNLISNAIDYTKEGGTVSIILEDTGNRVSVAVKDTGIGIPGTYIPELFHKFARADNAIRMRPDGSGLGLYIVSNIVEHHGSTIAVESKEGVGSTFSFTVPKKEADLVPQGTTVKEFFEKF